MVLGVVVIGGWFANIGAIKSVVPGATNMNPLSATCFLLIGISFILAASEMSISHKRIVWANAAIVFIAGGSVLLRYLVGLPLYADKLLFADKLAGTSMAPNSALCFIVVSYAMFLLPLKLASRDIFLKMLSILVGLIGIIALIGYATGSRNLYGISLLTPMAIHVAAAFILIAYVLYLFSTREAHIWLSRRITALITLMILITVLANTFAYNALGAIEAPMAALSASKEVKIMTDKLLMSSLDAETGQRGYLLTGNKAYLEPYNNALVSYKRDILSLRKMLTSVPEALKIMDRLEASYNDKLKELALTISLRQTQGFQAALRVVQTNEGKQYEDEIRLQTANLNEVEQRFYENAHTIAARTSHSASSIVLVTSFLNVALLVIVFYVLSQDSVKTSLRRKELEDYSALLSGQKKQDEAVLSSINDGVLGIDLDGKIIIFNRIASEMTGYGKAEALFKPYDEIVTFVNGRTNRPQTSFIKAALSGRKSAMPDNTILVTKSGQRIPVADSAAAIVDNENNVLGAVVVFRDITEALKLDQAKEEFVSLASHQLRTPATAVKQFIGMIKEGYAGEMNPDQQSFINDAYESNERQLRIIDDLLSVARADSGRMKLVFELTDIHALVMAVLDEQKATIEGRRQHLVLYPPGKQLHANVDVSKMRMVIENLISNASKYTLEGGEISVSFSESNHSVQIVVKDNGVGIAAADIGKLFQRFSRINNELSTKVGGTGLGLYLAKMIVDLHHGTIIATSILGQGTVFTVKIPRKG